MNAPLFSSPPQDNYQAEAVKLVAWLYRMSEFFSRHAPALREDIENFSDAAALLDSFRAGLVPVNYHPKMRMETVRWVDPAVTMPDSDRTVLIDIKGYDQTFLGFYEIAVGWCGLDGFKIRGKVLGWADLPAVPIKAAAAEVQS